MPRKNSILDPAGHLGLNVLNFSESSKFYSKLFEVLGFKRIKLSENKAAWTTREGFGIWLYQTQNSNRKMTSGAPGIQHLCFKAKTKKDVDKVYALLLKLKARVFGEPRLIGYLPNYYAVYFTDPNGIKLEVAYY